ncbi:DMT family transporter [Pseudoroseicyclus sp. CXY001]|uniref:DMT family transporter n=1 Tax=Pseudoroseicyclus sp. CXY001 TaxID=3242492 RepID=UPI00358DC98C
MTALPVQKSISGVTWAQMLTLALIWGATFLANSVALGGTAPAWITAGRTALSVPVLWIAVLVARQPLPRGWGLWGALIVMGGLNNVIPFTLIAWGQQHVPSGLAAILNASTALWGMSFAAIAFTDERMTGAKAAGLALGFSGVVLVIGPAALSGFDPTALGQLAILGATVSYGLASVWARRRLAHLPPLTSAAGMLTGASLLAVPLAFALSGPPGALPAGAIGAVLYLALAATAFAFILYYRIMAAAGSGNTLLVTLLVAPIGVALGAVILGETLPLRAWPGFALIACGLVAIDGRLIRRIRLARRQAPR